MKLRLTLLLLAGLAAAAPLASQEPANSPPHLEEISWVNPLDSLPVGVTHHTFQSQSLGREVGYTIYLPAAYETGTEALPVIYWLHGRGGNEADTRPSQALHEAIEGGRVQPMVLVTVNGGAGSGYFDNPGTGVRSESLIVRDLIPHIEGTYRVSASQSGRGIAGFSMGGAGAIRLVLRNSDLFGSVVSFGGMLIPQRQFMEEHAVTEQRLAVNHDVYALAVNATAQMRPVGFQFFVGSADQFLADNRRFVTHLLANNMEPDYEEIPGLEHNLTDYLAEVGLDMFRFHSSRLEPGR